MHVQSCCFANQTYCFFDVLAAVPVVVAKAPFSIDDGNGSENVTFKMYSRFSNTVAFIPVAENGKCRRISLELIS